MNIIKPEVIDITQTDFSIKGIHKQIELAARTCYKSEDKITEDSAEPFVKMLEDRGHTAMLEHGTVYLKFEHDFAYADPFYSSPYSAVTLSANAAYITTNLRAVNELHMQYVLDPKFMHYEQGLHNPRYSFRIICSIGVARELCRHRVFSFAQESTRYCNYTKEKFGGVSFIEPYWYKDADSISQDLFKSNLEIASVSYRAMINNKMMAQQAREILPLATKTEIVMTGTLSQWTQFLSLRLSSAAHPDMRIIANKIKDLIDGKEKG